MVVIGSSLLPLLCRSCTQYFLLLSLFVSMLALNGCATENSTKLDSLDDSVNLAWPLPPEEPRIKFLRSFFSEDQIVPPLPSMSLFRDELLGKPRQSGRQLKKPYAVHADEMGRVFVADSGWGKVLVFDEKNKSFSVWGTEGKGILSKPLGITSDSQNNIYVTDSIKQRVVVYMPDGTFLRAMGRKGDLERPIGIAVDEQRNRVYVVDSKAHHIVVFNMAGKMLKKIGQRGDQAGQFNWPTNIALDANGKLYIVDSMNFRIQILKPDGSFDKAFGSHGDTRGQFVRAKGIAVDALGHIYVTDAAFNNFQVFNADGSLLLDVGSMGRKPGQFILPAGLFIDKSNRIYIADQYNFRIQVFQYLETMKKFDRQAKISN